MDICIMCWLSVHWIVFFVLLTPFFKFQAAILDSSRDRSCSHCSWKIYFYNVVKLAQDMPKSCVAVNCTNHNFMTKKSWHFIYFRTKKDIVNVGKSVFNPAKEKMLMEASGNQKEDMFIYAQSILLQVCLIWIFININIIWKWPSNYAFYFYL